ncbi:MAG: adenylosuccinate synthetase [Cyanobacteria bacterium]|nr:adenylosuccinate synthetase [Cyanobacteriota bacterium]
MITGHAVIGANYGDEGKGLMTDYLASLAPDRSLVVRFNGGAQAGHTVSLPDGRRHVFSHFGAGSFAGCPTVLSRFFIVNPIAFVRERRALGRIGLEPTVTIHGDALLTTPFDMLINRVVETKRGDAKHGSCGLGINETVTRCLHGDYGVFATRTSEMLNSGRLHSRLLRLGQEWLPVRLAEHGISLDVPDVRHFTDNMERILAQFIIDSKELLESAAITSSHPECERVIFEGAQGLMLDEDRVELWPHVTRSRTGLANVMALLPEFQINELEVVYMTRSYLTRHGAGPLPGEYTLSFPDATNIPNQFQGHLRFAPLDWCVLNASIARDLENAASTTISIGAKLAITCMDQVIVDYSESEIPVQFLSYGPSRADLVSRRAEAVSLYSVAGTGIESRSSILR